MRILYFSTRECWPANTGARLRDLYLARELAKHFSITYLAFMRDHKMREPLRIRLKELNHAECILLPGRGAYSVLRLVRGLCGRVPVTVLNFTAADMRSELSRLLSEKRFDFVQMEGVHLAQYMPVVFAAPHRARLVCDWHNIESELMWRYSQNTSNLAKRLYAARTSRLLEGLEQTLLQQCDAHIVCSQRERSALLHRSAGARIHVIGNGVDVDFLSDPAVHSAMGPRTNPRRDLVFVGSMDYHANIDAALHFASDIWPHLHAQQPDTRLWIVGSRPGPKVLALGNQPGITVTGTVDDVRPYYRGALAVVAPIRVASGTRLKILEAMAAGVPVISTKLGIEGLDVTPDTDLLVADSPAEMSAAVSRLAGSDELWQRLAASGRAVAHRYDWSVLGASLRQFYSELLTQDAAS